jgi:hypothetical protein
MSQQARVLDERARRATYAPMNPYELQQLQVQVSQLAQRAHDIGSRGRYGYHRAYGNQYGYGAQNGYYDRGDRNGYDRDNGRDDDDGD